MMMIPKYLDIVADDYREHIHDIEQMNQSGYWLADFSTQQLSLSRGACELLEVLPEHETNTSVFDHLKLTPELSMGDIFNSQTIAPDDERILFIPPNRHIRVRYQTLFSDSREPERRVGALYDISARVEQENRALSFQRELITSFFNSVVLITQAIESRDPYTSKHQYSVAAISLAIGEHMGLSDHDKVGLWLGAAIHDIGKIGVPIAILGKPGKLRDTEFALIKEHPKIAESILHTAHYPWPIKGIVTQHHERLDGSGYPYGLKGDEIHLEAQIVAVADVYEAMAHARPYRFGLGPELALEELNKNAGIGYNAQVVNILERLVKEECDFERYDRAYVNQLLDKTINAQVERLAYAQSQ